MGGYNNNGRHNISRKEISDLLQEKDFWLLKAGESKELDQAVQTIYDKFGMGVEMYYKQEGNTDHVVAYKYDWISPSFPGKNLKKGQKENALEYLFYITAQAPDTQRKKNDLICPITVLTCKLALYVHFYHNPKMEIKRMEKELDKDYSHYPSNKFSPDEVHHFLTSYISKRHRESLQINPSTGIKTAHDGIAAYNRLKKL